MKEKRDFITSYFAWLKPDKQKENAKRLEKITKKDDENNKKKG